MYDQEKLTYTHKPLVVRAESSVKLVLYFTRDKKGLVVSELVIFARHPRNGLTENSEEDSICYRHFYLSPASCCFQVPTNLPARVRRIFGNYLVGIQVNIVPVRPGFQTVDRAVKNGCWTRGNTIMHPFFLASILKSFSSHTPMTNQFWTAYHRTPGKAWSTATVKFY